MQAVEQRNPHHVRGVHCRTTPCPPSCAQMTIREALNSAIDEEMDRDKTVVLLGASRGSAAGEGALHHAQHPACCPTPLPAQRRRRRRMPPVAILYAQVRKLLSTRARTRCVSFASAAARSQNRRLACTKRRTPPPTPGFEGSLAEVGL